MRVRVQQLTRNSLTQRAHLLLCSDRASIADQIRLRVVREFGLPDSAVEFLQRCHHIAPPQDHSLPFLGSAGGGSNSSGSASACYLTPVHMQNPVVLCDGHAMMTPHLRLRHTARCQQDARSKAGLGLDKSSMACSHTYIEVFVY